MPQERDLLNNVIDEVNEHLAPLFMEIRQVKYERDGLTYRGLVNMRNEENTKQVASYSALEMDLLRKIVR